MNEVPPGHGKPRSCTPPPRTGDVAALVHLEVVLVAGDILLPQLQYKRIQCTRESTCHPKKKGDMGSGSRLNSSSRESYEEPGRPLSGALGALLWHLLVIVRAAAAPGAHQPTQAGDMWSHGDPGKAADAARRSSVESGKATKVT